MSFQVGSACYSTDVEAAGAVASSLVGTLRGSGGYLYAVDVSSVSGSGLTLSFTAVDGGPGLAAVSVPLTLQPCGLLDSGDALSLSWLVVGVWVAAWAVSGALGGALRGWFGGDDGDS